MAPGRWWIVESLCEMQKSPARWPGFLFGTPMRVRQPFIGLISDTHGLLRPQAVEALRGSDLIIHAGDIGKPEILEALAEIAPVHAVRGNNDRGAWAEMIPECRIILYQEKRIQVLHDMHDLKTEAAEKQIDVVICGHSHRPRVHEKDGVLYVNPGSAGPRRFKLPVAVGRIEWTGKSLRAEIITLDA